MIVIEFTNLLNYQNSWTSHYVYACVSIGFVYAFWYFFLHILAKYTDLSVYFLFFWLS